jgi:hypothetical protein
VGGRCPSTRCEPNHVDSTTESPVLVKIDVRGSLVDDVGARVHGVATGWGVGQGAGRQVFGLVPAPLVLPDERQLRQVPGLLPVRVTETLHQLPSSSPGRTSRIRSWLGQGGGVLPRVHSGAAARPSAPSSRPSAVVS